MKSLNDECLISKVDRTRLESVKGEIGFARRSKDEAAPARDSHPGYTIPLVSYDVRIRDARPITKELTLEKEGFKLINRKLSCLDERNPETLRKKYMEEMVPFIKDYFSASWVTTADLGGFSLRSLGGDMLSRQGVQADQLLVKNFGTGMAHIDYSPVAGPMIAARDSQLQGIDIQSYARILIIQTWQAISPPPQDFPLAFCDATSIDLADLVDTYHSKYGVTTRSWGLKFNPAQDWYYFPEMTRDEFILFLGYDSDTHFDARAAHAAFDNRRAFPSANPRESIETRFYVYYA